ncbi:sigma-54-dependent Fis family transcriptional regulator [Streptomyces sp. NPDC002845]
MTTTEHSPVRPALASLRRARERFLTGLPLPDGVPDEIVDAWKRARFFGVPHDLPHGWREPGSVVRPADSALLTAARPVLDRIAPALGTQHSALVLTDERLRVLWTAGRMPGDDTCRDDLSEQAVGHNSAALALRTRRRAEVHGPEHFLDLWQDVSAVSVPVPAPETGRVLGTLTVSSALCAECAPHPGAALAEAAVAAVEAELLARSRSAERVLLDAYQRAVRGRTRAVVALDGCTRIVSEAAEELLTPEGLTALERDALAAVRRDAADPYGIRLHEGAGCSATVTPVRHLGSAIGVVAVLEPVGPMSRVPVPSTGRATVVALAGRSTPWRHAVDRAVELARSRKPLLLIGERGTGKTSLARELAGRSATVDAAEDGLGPLIEELAEGRALLLRHAERLAQPDVAALNSLLGTRPGVPLFATYTPGTPPGPCLQRLLDTLSARSVTLPALRERPEDIRELLPALSPPTETGRPPLTWTLDALRALERHPWPGNVTELAHLVRALAEHRRATGPVRRTELPDPVREGPAHRHLSPMEHAERTAILEALRHHGGNKARTAAALGIARATLYRKLRGYEGSATGR